MVSCYQCQYIRTHYQNSFVRLFYNSNINKKKRIMYLIFFFFFLLKAFERNCVDIQISTDSDLKKFDVVEDGVVNDRWAMNAQ